MMSRRRLIDCLLLHLSVIAVAYFSQNGLTPLILAAQNDSGRAVQALLKAGVDVNAVDKVRECVWCEGR
jgi:ankyrin repeat protein